MADSPDPTASEPVIPPPGAKLDYGNRKNVGVVLQINKEWSLLGNATHMPVYNVLNASGSSVNFHVPRQSWKSCSNMPVDKDWRFKDVQDELRKRDVDPATMQILAIDIEESGYGEQCIMKPGFTTVVNFKLVMHTEKDEEGTPTRFAPAQPSEDPEFWTPIMTRSIYAIRDDTVYRHNQSFTDQFFDTDVRKLEAAHPMWFDKSTPLVIIADLLRNGRHSESRELMLQNMLTYCAEEDVNSAKMLIYAFSQNKPLTDIEKEATEYASQHFNEEAQRVFDKQHKFLDSLRHMELTETPLKLFCLQDHRASHNLRLTVAGGAIRSMMAAQALAPERSLITKYVVDNNKDTSAEQRQAVFTYLCRKILCQANIETDFDGPTMKDIGRDIRRAHKQKFPAYLHARNLREHFAECATRIAKRYETILKDTATTEQTHEQYRCNGLFCVGPAYVDRAAIYDEAGQIAVDPDKVSNSDPEAPKLKYRPVFVRQMNKIVVVASNKFVERLYAQTAEGIDPSRSV
jgi:hypothetical protein